MALQTPARSGDGAAAGLGDDQLRAARRSRPPAPPVDLLAGEAVARRAAGRRLPPRWPRRSCRRSRRRSRAGAPGRSKASSGASTISGSTGGRSGAGSVHLERPGDQRQLGAPGDETPAAGPRPASAAAAARAPSQCRRAASGSVSISSASGQNSATSRPLPPGQRRERVPSRAAGSLRHATVAGDRQPAARASRAEARACVSATVGIGCGHRSAPGGKWRCRRSRFVVSSLGPATQVGAM